MNFERISCLKSRAITILLTLATTSLFSQAGKGDSVSIFKEFLSIGAWHQRVPLQMNIHFLSTTIPHAASADVKGNDMTLFYGKSESYMLSDGLEQVTGDSLVLMVNEEAKVIRVTANTGVFKTNFQQQKAMFRTDSSVVSLMTRYSATARVEENGLKRITLFSKDTITGTSLTRETITVTYNQLTFQPETFLQSKFSLVPLDSATYHFLKGETQYNDKLTSWSAEGIKFYFLTKEQRIECTFSKVQYNVLSSPVKIHDRVHRLDDGNYRGVDKYESYLIINESR
jgi:hypothetical protein